MISRAIQTLRKHFMVLVAGLCFLIHAFGLFANPDTRGPLLGDGHGYFVWLPAPLIQRDPGFRATVDGFHPGLPDQLGITLVPATGRYASKYNVTAWISQPTARPAHTVFLGLACLWSLWWMKLFHTREIHIKGLDRQAL